MLIFIINLSVLFKNKKRSGKKPDPYTTQI